MAYRFLLAVPGYLADDANIAVSGAGDAQVLVMRSSHGLGFEDEYLDLTVAAHSLRVISTVYTWYESLAEPRPEVQLALHSGERLLLKQHDRGSLVAAIRRDQPWVERTVPHIGDHLVDTPTRPGPSDATDGGTMTASRTALVNPVDASRVGTAPLERTWASLPAAERAGRNVSIRGINHIAIRVTEIGKAERFYSTVLGMDVVARGKQGPGGGFELVDGPVRAQAAEATAQAPDVSFMRNGPLVIGLHRVGRGARIERDVLDHISLRVDASTYRQIKGEALMIPLEILATGENAFVFRDPFSVTWEVSMQGLPEFVG